MRCKRAKKFVLDDDMSTFLGELSTQAFTRPHMTQKSRNKVIEHLRLGARLPSEITWIEYNLRLCQTRGQALLGNPVGDPLQMPETEGWLLMRHPKLDTAFLAHIVSHDAHVDFVDGFKTWTFPVANGWTADMDTVLPWRSLPFSKESSAPSEVATGLLGYKTDRCGYVFSPMLITPQNSKTVSNMVQEWGGVQRRMWALLSTINDLPVAMTNVRQAKGFVAKGSYRKFLDYNTITLTVPEKQYTKVIRKALAIAHRRGGSVREHWRQDWRRPLSVLCDHEWGADENHMFCTLCKGRKIWVHEHVRGDTTRGFVQHDYRITHDKGAN